VIFEQWIEPGQRRVFYVCISRVRRLGKALRAYI